MATLDPTTVKTIKDVLTVGEEIYGFLKEKNLYSKIRDLFVDRPNQYILVFGASGTGKTSILKSLKGQNPYIPRNERTVYAEGHEFESKDMNFTLIDTPGESVARERRLQAILDILPKASSSTGIGVINVVSYGYHEGPSGDQPLSKNNIVNPSYLVNRRMHECSQVHEWAPLLFGQHGAASWLITIVTKADLWWTPTSEAEVLAHYTAANSDYIKALGDAMKYPYRTCILSSIYQCFYDRGRMSGYYTDDQRTRNFKTIMESIVECAMEARPR